MPTKEKKPIINAHAHIFTGFFVPPYLARTFLVDPLYRLVNTKWIIDAFRRHYKKQFKKIYARSDKEDDYENALETKELRAEKFSRRKKARKKADRETWISNATVVNFVYRGLQTYISIIATLYLLEFIAKIFKITINLVPWFDIRTLLGDLHITFKNDWWFKILWIIVALIFVRLTRQFIIMALKRAFPFLKSLLSKRYADMIDRYMLMGRFAFYDRQADVAKRALHQLPPDSGLVILPMDMEYMGAGKTKVTPEMKKDMNDRLKDGWTREDFEDSYKYQMKEIWEYARDSDTTTPNNSGYQIGKTKDHLYPFIFIDPRRCEKQNKSKEEKKNKNFFEYDASFLAFEEEEVDGKIVMKDCFVKRYIEERDFAGFKIYPALGYYAFDPYLLPLWRYAAENNIPIMTHCVKGTIYYRGVKKTEWNYHPVFMERYEDYKSKKDKDDLKHFGQKLLPDQKNVDFQLQFTHPLNYLCLVDPKMFEIMMNTTYKNHPVRKYFLDKDGNVVHHLANLKICLAHYGGEGEWTRYMEQDREKYSQRLMRDPDESIRFIKERSEEAISWYKIGELWHDADWYSIISSLLIEYPNMYADLSYIISKPSIYPLLKYSLEKDTDYPEEHEAFLAQQDPHKKALHYTGKNKLRSRILFGTDFYVVRNHNSDKDLLIKAKTLLSEEEFDLIARENPYYYLLRD